MEIIKDIAAIMGLILSMTSVITLCTKGGRKLIYRWVKTNTQDLQDTNQKQNKDIEDIKATLIKLNDKIDSLSSESSDIKNVMMQQCRNIVKNIYYKYHEAKKIPLYERKTVDKTFEIYHDRLGGNSYIQLLYNEIKKWEIDTVNYPVLEED